MSGNNLLAFFAEESNAVLKYNQDEQKEREK